MSSTSGSISSSGGCTETIASRATIVALRNSGALVPGCTYTANDISWVSAAGISDFTATATAPDALSSTGYFESPTLNSGEPWEGEMDWDNGRIYYLKDSVTRENTVWGDTEVQTFPWSTTTVTRTTVIHSSFVFTSGTVDNVIIDGGSNLTLNGGVVRDSTFTSGARASITANSTLQDVIVASDGFLSVTGAGSNILHTEVKSQASLFVGVATRIEESSFTTRTTAYFQGGSHSSFVASNYGYVDARGWTGSFTRVTLEGADLRISGTGRFDNANFSGLGYLRLANLENLSLTHLNFSGYGYLSAANARNLRISYVSFDGMGYLYCDRSFQLRLERCNFDQNGTMSLNDCNNLNITRCKVSQSSSLTGTRASGSIDVVTVSESSSLNVSDATRLNLDLMTISNGSQLDARTSSNFVARETRLDNNTNFYISASADCRLYYGAFSGVNVYMRRCRRCNFDYGAILTGYITLDDANEVLITHLSTSGYGYLAGNRCPAGRITRVTINSYGLLRLQRTIASGWRIENTTIDSQGDVRMESAGLINRSHITSGAILTTRHTGTIDRAFVMQITSTQTAPSTNLRLHSGGAF